MESEKIRNDLLDQLPHRRLNASKMMPESGR
jgi:hypothetical protein